MPKTQITTALLFKEKNGDRYFDASTAERRALACRLVLGDRMNQGYWYNRPQEPEFDQETLDLLAIEGEAFFSTSGLPESIASELYTKKTAAERRVRRAKEDFEQENSWFTRADAVLALSEADFLASIVTDAHGRTRPSEAELLLDERSDYEYEEMTTVTFFVVQPAD